MDTLYRNYEILSEFYQKYYVDLRVLDLTCDPSSFPAPTVLNGRVVKYLEVPFSSRSHFSQMAFVLSQGD